MLPKEEMANCLLSWSSLRFLTVSHPGSFKSLFSSSSLLTNSSFSIGRNFVKMLLSSNISRISSSSSSDRLMISGESPSSSRVTVVMLPAAQWYVLTRFFYTWNNLMNPMFIGTYRSIWSDKSANFVMNCFQLILSLIAFSEKNQLILSGLADQWPMIIGFIRLIWNHLQRPKNSELYLGKIWQSMITIENKMEYN